MGGRAVYTKQVQCKCPGAVATCEWHESQPVRCRELVSPLRTGRDGKGSCPEAWLHHPVSAGTLPAGEHSFPFHFLLPGESLPGRAWVAAVPGREPGGSMPVPVLLQPQHPRPSRVLLGGLCTR